jgi:hypothetical protein
LVLTDLDNINGLEALSIFYTNPCVSYKEKPKDPGQLHPSLLLFFACKVGEEGSMSENLVHAFIREKKEEALDGSSRSTTIIGSHSMGGVKGLPFTRCFLLKTHCHVIDPWEESIIRWCIQRLPILSSSISLYIYEPLVTVRVRCARDL